MAIKFQYNKTSLQQLEKNLKMRQRTLPIIKNKETALRLEVKKSKQEAEDLEQKLQQQIGGYESMYALWGEFDASLVSLKDVQLDVKKVAACACAAQHRTGRETFRIVLGTEVVLRRHQPVAGIGQDRRGT